MDAVVDGGVRRIVEADHPPRLEEPAEHRNAVEVEAELGGDPRRGEEDEGGRQRDPEAVAAHMAGRLRPRGEQGEDECERDAGGRDGVDRPRVEIRLPHDSRHREHHAEHRRDDGERAGPAVKPADDGGEHCERDERVGEVQLDDGATEPAADPLPLTL